MTARSFSWLAVVALLVWPVVEVAASEVAFRTGDTIELRIGGVPAEETQLIAGAYTVDGEGFINLPHIGKVRAAGLSQATLQRAVEAAYRWGDMLQKRREMMESWAHFSAQVMPLDGTVIGINERRVA